MTDSKHKQIVDKVVALISAIEGKVTVAANAPMPEEVPEDGLVIVRDIEAEPSDETLGGFDELYMTGILPVEVFVRSGDNDRRDVKYDELLQAISAVLLERDAIGNRSLGGLVFGVIVDRPDPVPQAVLGAAAVKAATIRVHLEYSAPSALG